MCHTTLAGRKAGSVSTNKSQFVDTLSTNKAYLEVLILDWNFFFIRIHICLFRILEIVGVRGATLSTFYLLIWYTDLRVEVYFELIMTL